ncbi:hypothetical protein [Azotobacter chroococcum]|uniref:Virulence factor n=1 Tax=Azotobacter chroococcum TaxID=353 RepID=A0AAP9Y9N5_9GAMM|nr:hypothetical protein [Azotobacter chroococcum]QQE87302.1 hypothetical protein GKQ51_13395 [Azotobacter chroococcum]
MYGIIINFDAEKLREMYSGPVHENAHADICSVLTEDFGFTCIQGDVYFGDESVSSITCVLAAQKLKERFSWFEASVKEIKMLRIDELNDLGPAIGRGSVSKKKGRPLLKVA